MYIEHLSCIFNSYEDIRNSIGSEHLRPRFLYQIIVHCLHFDERVELVTHKHTIVFIISLISCFHMNPWAKGSKNSTVLCNQQMSSIRTDIKPRHVGLTMGTLQ